MKRFDLSTMLGLQFVAFSGECVMGEADKIGELIECVLGKETQFWSRSRTQEDAKEVFSILHNENLSILDFVSVDIATFWDFVQDEANPTKEEEKSFVAACKADYNLEDHYEVKTFLERDEDAFFEVRPSIGSKLQQAFKVAGTMAYKYECTAKFEFNGKSFEVHQGEDWFKLYSEWKAEAERKRQEYLNSPEYIQRQKEHEKRELEIKERQTLFLQSVLEKGEYGFEVADEEKWIECVEKYMNCDMSLAAIRFASKWASVMEEKMDEGYSIPEIAKQAEAQADDEGISGAMYNLAVFALSKCWKHGEVLRVWHNKKYLNDEQMQKANENLAVVNTSVINVG